MFRHSRFLRHFVFISYLFIGVVSAQAAVVGVTPKSTSPLKTFAFRIPDEPETLDWNRAHTPVESKVLTNLMEGLVSFDSGTQVVPALAESWTVSTDGKVYTFKLRSGVKWSDGVPLRAQDFVASWKRLLSPLTAASYAYLLFDIEGAEAYNRGAQQDFGMVGIKAINDQTFQVTLTQAIAHWIYIPAFWVAFPVRQDVIDKYGESWAKPGRMVTIGPFTLASQDLNSRIVMKANHNYWGSRGNLDQAIARVVKSDATALTLYDAGELDFMSDFAALDLKSLRSRSELKFFPHFKTAFLGFVTDKFPASNKKVRRAISMAIDKEKLVKLLQAEQIPATSFVPSPLMGYSKTAGLKFNPSLAMIELKNSGMDFTDRTFTLDYLLPNWDKAGLIGDFIQSQLKKNLGIEVKLHAFDNQAYRAKMDLNAYTLFDSTWTADYPDPDNFFSVFLGSSGNSRTTWKNESYDQAVLVARQTKGGTQREKMYLELQKTLIEDEAVIVPLFYEPNAVLTRSRVKKLDLNPMGYLYLRKVNVDS